MTVEKETWIDKKKEKENCSKWELKKLLDLIFGLFLFIEPFREKPVSLRFHSFIHY